MFVGRIKGLKEVARETDGWTKGIDERLWMDRTNDGWTNEGSDICLFGK